MLYLKIDGTRIPKLGFGTWELNDEAATESVLDALSMGYRHIDTAQAYGNHRAVGKALAQSGVPRKDIFLTTKIWMDNFRPQALHDSLDDSLEQLGTDRVDLLLLHWPNPEVPLAQTLEALAKARDDGKTWLIGVSNFTTDLLDEAVEKSPVRLVTNQVEYHPYLNQEPVLERVRRYDMSLTAYSPLGHGEVVGDSLLSRIGGKYGKSPCQVALRWLIQQPEVLAIPKAENREHAKENLDIFDFELTESEMEEIFGLARPDGRIIDPDHAPRWDNAA
ncbi:MAG: aldo/keto reductase [Xanthomonadales bacterium]|nr:aldo/keto reductase [Xanthomonadales bacterium]